MTQMMAAREGRVTPEMTHVARDEKVPVEVILEGVARGTIIIPHSGGRSKATRAVGIGRGLRTKVNASVGASSEGSDAGGEIDKLRVAISAGADTIMELSSGGDLDFLRRQVLEIAPVPVGTVPIYQAALEAIEQRGSIVDMTPEDMFEVIERQGADGVDFMAIHCALSLEVVARLRQQGRVADIVSRGGAFLTAWMLHHERENPLYEQFDRVLEIAKRHDVTLSIGDAIRPGCIADSLDRAQVQGLLLVGELVERAREAGVQVMVEGPGHVPVPQIEATVLLEKQVCKGAPYFVLGTLVTDIAPGYDHITAAIGGTIAATAGADFICYVTPAEHLGLPSAQDVREGVIAARIAAHAADLAKGVKGAWAWDLAMARARKALDWEAQFRLAMDPDKPRRLRAERSPGGSDACSMCGPHCAMKLISEYLGRKEIETC